MSIDIGGSKVPSPHCSTSIFDMPHLEISSMESKSIYFLVMMNVSRNIIRGGSPILEMSALVETMHAECFCWG